MNPYQYVKDATANGESLLSLCCGIGLELSGLSTNDITAVDITPQYLERVSHKCPQAKTICSDVLAFLKQTPDNSYDVISIIDGIEHMDKRTGVKVIEQMRRVCKREILLFTPQGHNEDGYLRNEPHNAWGIEGADEHQKHKSGWKQEELENLGFTLMRSVEDVSQHNDPYTALMMCFRKV